MSLCLRLVVIVTLGSRRKVLARTGPVKMCWRKLMVLRDSTEILNKGVVGG